MRVKRARTLDRRVYEPVFLWVGTLVERLQNGPMRTLLRAVKKGPNFSVAKIAAVERLFWRCTVQRREPGLVEKRH